VFLVGPSSIYITGALLPVGGGATTCRKRRQTLPR
jgi:hypothetical protein